MNTYSIAQTLGDWEWEFQKPHGNEIYSITFLNEDLGWVGAQGGIIQRTTDGGETWELHSLANLNSVNAIAFVNEQIGWAGLNSGEIYYTADGGETWGVQFEFSSGSVQDFHFIDEQTGWAVGGSGRAYRTQDGGNTWERVTEVEGETSGFATTTLNAVSFDDTGNGIIVGRSGSLSNHIFRTNDGGDSWISTWTSTTYQAVQFVDEQTAWIAGEDATIQKTTDGGENWNSFSNNIDSDRNIMDMHFTDENTGWVTGRQGMLFKTTDGGDTWIDQSIENRNSTRAIFAHNADVAWVGGVIGMLLHTTDGGENWNDYNPYENLTSDDIVSIHFIDDNTGWLMTYRSVGFFVPFMSIFKTTDGGQDWELIFEVEGERYEKLFFIDQDTGWAIGRNGLIMHTTDGGENWEAQESDTEETLNSIYFQDSELGWVTGDEGIIIKTTDGGSNWQSQTSGTSVDLTAISFVNETHGWAAGDDGTIQRTTDGGENWSSTNTSVNWNLTAIDFLNEETGWAVGARGTVLKTANGGDNWEFISHQTSFGTMTSLHLIDENKAWVTDSNGLLSYTQNGGQNWVRSITRSPNRINQLQFLESGTGWAAGNDGTVFKFTPADTPNTPILLKPSNGSTDLPADDTEFDWVPVFNAESYQIQIASDSEFENVFLNETEITQTQFTPENELPGGELFWRVRSVYGDAHSEWSLVFSLTADGTGSIPSSADREAELLPGQVNLQPNYPNPFNPTTNITFELGSASDISLRVYDITGRLVAELANGHHARGTHNVRFDASHLASGMYLYRLTSANHTFTKKMMLVK